MILLLHENNKALQVLDANMQPLDIRLGASIAHTLLGLAKAHPHAVIVWCNKAYLEYVNLAALPDIFHHQLIMASFSVSGQNFVPKSIGFVDPSVFLNVKREQRYPTWLMSSDVGGVSAEFLNAITSVKTSENFDYFINSLAKRAMPKGLFCYSEPRLVKTLPPQFIQTPEASNTKLFKFVKQHYKWVWVFVLLCCFVIYQKRFPLWAFLKTLFCQKQPLVFKPLKVRSSKSVITQKTIDVIIPTIGRPSYLYDVLKDLSAQTLLPKQVIIVEQNPHKGSVSELDFIKEETWPFKIKHIFTHRAGAWQCQKPGLGSCGKRMGVFE